MSKESIVTEYIKEGFDKQRLMQLATVGENGPWICTVHFVADEEMSLCWLSLPSRRHSKELAIDPRVAVTIAVKPEMPVIGIQSEGRAEEVQDSEAIKIIMEKYVNKYKIGGDFYKNFIAGINKHKLYKFVPARISLFDEVNFKDTSPIELLMNKMQTI